MRLGGAEVSGSVVRTVALSWTAIFLLTWIIDSFSTAVLILTSFCFGAGVFSLVLDICPNNQLPNFLASLKCPRLHSLNCDLDRCRSEPWRGLEVPVEIDRALSDLYERILREYIYPWYGQVSLDEQFVHEVRLALRHATAVLVKRVGKLDLTSLITGKGIPVGLSHVDSFLHANQYAKAFGTPITDAYYDFLGHDIHPATHNREKEILYVQNTAKRVIPYLVPKKMVESGTVFTLLSDILSGAVLQPVMDILADPDIINFILMVAFDEEPAMKFPEASGRKVEFLKKFAAASSPHSISALQMDLSAILKNQQALFAFMQFLKEEGSINQLQFCLSIEDFNKRIMIPDLSDGELSSLHAEALELYNLYLKPTSSHSVEISSDLVQDIYKILSGPSSNVVKLRTTAPLFKAYEEVINNLERLCPDFYKSEHYFSYLLGKRVNNADYGSKRGNGRKSSWLKKRLGKSHRSTDSGSSSPSSTSQLPSPSTPVITIDESPAVPKAALPYPGGIPNPFFPSLQQAEQQQLTRSSSEIDLARASALSSLSDLPGSRPRLSASVSMENLSSLSPDSAESPDSSPVSPPETWRRQRSVSINHDPTEQLGDEQAAEEKSRKKLKKRLRKLSGASSTENLAPAPKLSTASPLQTAFPLGLGSVRYSGKVQNPYGQAASMGKQLLLRSAASVLNLSHGGGGRTRDRSKLDLNLGRGGERIGKGLTKLRHGVLGKSMEGIVDSLDPALDLADYCTGEEEEGDDTISAGNEGLNELLEGRDLSSWKVSIPRVATALDGGGKACFVFVVVVRRTSGEDQPAAGSPDKEWHVHRQHHEFYALESKLTEFHGEFADARLPSKSPKQLFSGRGLDVMQAKKEAFEDYLRSMVQKPALKGSDILSTFLTATEEFTTASGTSANLGFGRMIKNVPMNLAKQRGQGLLPFITTFMAQTQPEPPKPRQDYVVGAKEYDITLERPISPHPVFRNNLGVSCQGVRLGHCHKYFKDVPVRKEEGVFDTLVYVAVNVFRVGQGRVQVLQGLRILLRRTLDTLVDYAIASKLAEVLSVRRVAHICKILEEALFGPSEVRTDDDKEERRRQAHRNLSQFLRPLLEAAVGGSEKYAEGVDLVFESVQNPVINKQLAFVLFDTALGEVFPELSTGEADYKH